MSILCWLTINHMLLLNLSDAEIQELNYERFHYPSPIVQRRIHAVYIKAVTGLSNEIVGTLSGLHRHSVDQWIKVYVREGFSALFEVHYGTNESELEGYSTNILKSFTQHPPMNANEAGSRIEDLTGIRRSPTQIRAFMKRHGLRYIKTGHIPAKADTVKQKEWVRSKLRPAVRAAKQGRCELLFMDASHFILQPFICALWTVARMFIKAASGRNRINVLGAVNALTKEVHTLSNTTYITAETIISFFIKLKEHYGEIPLKIVLDNARYQHCKLVEQAAKKLNITLLFLPSYSPNLNIIERLWKFTKRKILYAKYYETPEKFHHAITGFFKNINEKHNQELQTLLSLKFQFFENENVLIYPV